MSRFRLFGFMAAPLSALVLLGGCQTLFGAGGTGAATSSVSATRARALVVGDEPFAVKAGASILAQGGSAVDAVTAMFFALSVTYPVAAGPGGGGICLVRDAGGAVQEFDFLPRAAARGGVYAAPGAVRGFFDMQKRFGSLPWQREVAAAEVLADAGFPLSEALRSRLTGTEAVIRLDAALAAEFLDESGQLKNAGTVVTNHALARTLGTIRQEGAEGFAQSVGARLVAYSASQGGALGMDDFTRYATRQSRAAQRAAGSLTIAFPAPGTGAGAFSAALLSRTAGATPATAGAATIAAVRETLSGFGITSVPADLGSTGFAALDANGSAASCAVTLNGPFGSGRTATDTGVQLASSPSGSAGLASAFLLPLIASDGQGGVRFAGAGAGGPNGDAAIAYALLRLAGGAPLATAADTRTTGAAPKDTINLIACQSVCVALPDPGGHGLGASGNAAEAAPP